MYKIIDFLSGKEVEAKNFVFCDGDSPWEIKVDLEQVKSKIHLEYFKRQAPSTSKYFPFMPVKDFRNFTSLNEGSTPLIKARSISEELGIEVFLKIETYNPTGSFKDRGSCLEVTVAKELGAKAIAVASTGNMAASCSCYAAAAGIPCFVFVPEGTPTSKLSQSIAFGGKIVQVKGTYNDAAALCVKVASEMGFYLAGDYAFRVEGHKTAGFELADQFYLNPPEFVMVPVGCGTNLAGYHKGFAEYKSIGLIDRVPRLVGCQAEGANSVVRAFNQRNIDVQAIDSVTTICSAIGIRRAIDGSKALRAIYDSNGYAVDVTDEEILEAQYQLSKQEGVYVEASCATTLAVLKKMVREGTIKTEESPRVVLVLTGDGLKDPSAVLKIAVKPPTINARLSEFKDLYERNFFSAPSVSFKGLDQVLFSKSSSLDEAQKIIQDNLGYEIDDSHLNTMRDFIEKFILKGKDVTLGDLRDIEQMSYQGLGDNESMAIKVKDFSVITAKDKPNSAQVVIDINGEERSAEGLGVGPVDAVINALRAAAGGDLPFLLSDFNVMIRGKGTDAVVYVEMELKSDGVKAVGQGTSPDVIQAAIEAFEVGFTELSRKIG